MRNYPVFNRVDIKDSIDPSQEFGTQLALTPLVSDALHHLVKYHQMDPSLYYEVPMKGVCIVQDSHVSQPPPCLCHGCGPWTAACRQGPRGAGEPPCRQEPPSMQDTREPANSMVANHKAKAKLETTSLLWQFGIVGPVGAIALHSSAECWKVRNKKLGSCKTLDIKPLIPAWHNWGNILARNSQDTWPDN